MNKMPLDQFYKENVKLIHFATRKGMARFFKANLGHVFDYEDVFGSLSEVFILSYNLFDAERLTSFSTYYTTACHHRVSGMMKSHIKSVESSTYAISNIATDQDDDLETVEVQFQDSRKFSEEVELENWIKHVRGGLSPFARVLLDYTLCPPDFIEQEFLAQRANSKVASACGAKTHHHQDVNLKFVSKCLRDMYSHVPNVNAFVKQARKEVEEAIKKINF